MVKEVTVIGAGTMGNGIAHIFAMEGFRVVLCDINQAGLDKAITTISANLDRMVKKEILSEDKKLSSLHNITTSTDLSSAVKNADLVIEVRRTVFERDRNFNLFEKFEMPAITRFFNLNGT